MGKQLSIDELNAVSGGMGLGNVTGQGSFASNTGTNLNLVVAWFATTDAFGNKILTVQVYTTSYSITSEQMTNAVELHANGMVLLADSMPIAYEGPGLANNLIAAFTLTNVAGPVNLEVVWHFRGSYSGVALEEIRAVGTAMV